MRTLPITFDHRKAAGMGILNRKGLAIAALAAGIVLAGCSGEKADGSKPGDGKKLFEATCASCHGSDAKGMPHLGKDLTTSKFAIGLSDKELVAFIKKGRSTSDPANTTGIAMPPKGGNPSLTDQQIQAIVGFLRSLEK